MAFYIILALIYMMLIPVEKLLLKKINRGVWACIVFSPLFFITAFRDLSVGADTLTYQSLFNIYSQQPISMNVNSNMEIGYVFANRVFGILNVNFTGFQIIYAAFIYVSLIVFTSRYSKNIAFSAFFFITFRLFFFSMTGIRQMIAMAILLWSVPFIEKRKPIIFLFLVIVATLFHNTAIIFLLLYLLPFVNFRSKNIAAILFLGFFVAFGAKYLINVFLMVFPKYGSYLSRIETYDGSFVYVQLFFVIFLLAITIIANKFSVANTNNFISNKVISRSRSQIRSSENNSTLKRVFLNAMIFSFMLSLLALEINIALRISRYFLIFTIVFIPNVLEEIRDTRVKIMLYYILIVCLWIYYVVIMFLRPEWEGVIPYKWMGS